MKRKIMGRVAAVALSLMMLGGVAQAGTFSTTRSTTVTRSTTSTYKAPSSGYRSSYKTPSVRTSSSQPSKSVTVVKKTTVNVTVVRPKVVIKRPTSLRPPVVYHHVPTVYYHNGSFAPYLLTGAGVYLMLHGFTHTGAPIYIDPYSGHTIDSGDLDHLHLKTVNNIPSQMPVRHRTNWIAVTCWSLVGVGLLWLLLRWLRRRKV